MICLLGQGHESNLLLPIDLVIVGAVMASRLFGAKPLHEPVVLIGPSRKKW